MTFAEYAAIKAVNMSTLKQIDVSPLHYLHAKTVPRKDTPAFRLGRAIHSAVLEPESFYADSVISSGLSTGSKAFELYEMLTGTDVTPAIYPGKVRRGKDWEAFQALYPNRPIALASEWQAVEPLIDAERQGKTILTQDEFDTASRVSESVHAHPFATSLLAGGEAEKTLQWEEEGVECKCRIDYLCPTYVVELKSTAHISPRAFGRQAAKFDYVAQCAFYASAAGVDDAWIVAVESQAPYDVACYQVSSDALAHGRARYQGWLRRVAECQASGVWPGVVPESQALDLPYWYMGLDNDPGLDWS